MEAGVNEVVIEDEVNTPVMFNVTLGITDVLSGEWRGIDLTTFKPGDRVELFMGFDSPVKMVTGEITALDITFDKYSCMEIRGYDLLHRLRRGAKRRTFQNVTDGDIASTMASDSGLSSQVTATSTMYPYVFQNNVSDYDFLIERMKRIGYEMLVRDRTLHFRVPQEAMTPSVSLTYGTDIERFWVGLNMQPFATSVEARGWDLAAKQEITSTATKGDELSLMGGKESGYDLAKAAFGASTATITDEAILDANEGGIVAKAYYNCNLAKFITGKGVCTGNPDIRAGVTIEVRGIGDRFSGNYYVVSSRHVYDYEQGYQTSFKVRRNAV
jgi:phage protein D